ncbi:MAG: DegT/DnrJ/EryC1/StrS family aminotransferase, partial [Leptonema sp. (in: Bacteria)]|nr:DegT/DnrJ/EryC1/StrS family aminotransferase [Leptonema sp. (in: bacteria)]
ISAALGRVQIRRHDSMLLRRRRIHETYSANFAELEGIRPCPEYTGSSHHLYTIEIDPQLTTRDDFAAMIESQNIRTGLHFIPLYRFSHYQKRYQHTYKSTDSNLPLEQEWKLHYSASEQIFSRLLSLPIYSSMSDQDIVDVVDAVKSAYSQLELEQREKNPS